MDISQVRQDLLDEQQALDEVCATLTEKQWQLDTPSQGWTCADQIGHLTYFDHTASLAITDPTEFARAAAELVGAADGDALTLAKYRSMSGAELMDAWRAGRQRLADAGATLSNSARVDWYGPSMGSKSFLTARLMEVWAHGQDIVDTVNANGGRVQRASSDRLRHIARLGFITHGWSFINRGMDAPAQPVRVVLTAPSGAEWDLGPEGARSSITGPAEDFCLVVTQRRHVDHTDLVLAGDPARDWMVHAQAFAGAPSFGPPAQ